MFVTYLFAHGLQYDVLNTNELWLYITYKRRYAANLNID